MTAYRADNTMLTKVGLCSAAYVARHVLGLRGTDPMIPAWVGNALHEGLRVHFGGGSAVQSEGAGFNEYQRLINDQGYAADDDRLGWGNVKRILGHYCATHPVEAFPLGEIVELERSVSVAMPAGWEFWMKRDMLVLGKDGMYSPLDHKSTGRVNAWWSGEFTMASQLSGYCWGTGQDTGTVCQSAYINAIEVSLLPSGTAKCYLHKVPKDECSLQHVKAEIFHTGRTPEQLAAWYNMANKLAKKGEWLSQAFPSVEYLRYVDREGQWIYKGCTGCNFKKWCRLDFKPELVEEFTVPDPWEPWNVEQQAGVTT